MKNLLHDLRYSVRMLVKNPGFTAVAALALALGIGANTATFSLADALLFRPLLLKDLDRLVYVFESREGEPNFSYQFSPADFVDFREQVKSLERLSAFDWWNVNLTGAGEPERVQGFRVTWEFFDVLGEKALYGRTFLPSEDEPGRNRVAVLGYGLWERRFGGDPKVIGSTVELNGEIHEVIGVMPRDFRYPAPAELWAPLAMDAKYRSAREAFDLRGVARLKPGASARQANAEVETIVRRLAQQFPRTHARRGGRVEPLREHASGDLTRAYTLLLLGAVAFVLLIACVNVANLQFARVSARGRELAVRAALGAGRWRLIRQLLTESVLLGLVGAGLGLLAAPWVIDLQRRGMPAEVEIYLPGWKRMGLNGMVLAYTLGIALLSGIIAGVAPALVGSRTDLNESLKEGGRGGSFGIRRHRMRSALVIGEIVLSMVLLIGAGLMVKGFRAVTDPAPNMAASQVLTMQIALPESKYSQGHQRVVLQQQVLERWRSLPQGELVALVSDIPYSGNSSNSFITIEGRPPARPGETPSAQLQAASPDYFRATRIPLRQGRVFADADGEDAAKVAVVSEALVRRYFSEQSPIGTRIKVGREDSTNPWYTVVGVVGDVRHDPFDRNPRATFYRPYAQAPPRAFGVMIRTAQDPNSLIAAARAAISSVDRNQPVFDVKTWQKVIDDQLVGYAYIAVLMAVSGALALVLATIGVYSVMAYSVTERTREIGVRMALGAQQGDVLWLMIRRGLVLTVIGSSIGLAAGLALSRVLSGLLFGVGSFDVVAFGGVVVLLLATALAACYFPARRAARTDPMVALRHE